MPDAPLSQTFEKRNAETSTNWAQFAHHRERITALLESSRLPHAWTLCVLGAGNCNDLDLPRLLQLFAQITLVDLDEQAMRQGVARQLDASLAGRVELACLDVTGAFELLGELAERRDHLEDADLRTLATLLGTYPAVPRLGRQFDCVISTCLLSQLIDAFRSVVGEQPQRFLPLVQLLRRQHVQTLLQLTAAGGVATLAFDFVSNVTCPSLEQIPQEQLLALAEQLIAQGNFFTGLKPSLVFQEFRAPAVSALLAQPPVLTVPWKWNLGPRTYLVAAVQAKRR